MKKAILFLAVAGIFASCAKSTDDNGPIDASKSKMLMNGKWQMVAYIVVPDITDSFAPPEDIYSPMWECHKDDFYIFNTTNTLTMYEGASKCAPSLPDSIVYNYELTDNENHLTAWSDPEDRDGSIAIDGDLTYPSTDSFILVFQQYNDSSKLTSRHTQTYVKIP